MHCLLKTNIKEGICKSARFISFTQHQYKTNKRIQATTKVGGHSLAAIQIYTNSRLIVIIRALKMKPKRLSDNFTAKQIKVNIEVKRGRLLGAIIKTADEIEKMRIAGRLAAEVLMMIGEHVKKGVTTDELNTLCHDYIVNQQNSIPAPLNYGNPPFPKSICTSVNHVICHGIPSDKKLKDGDIVNIDVTVIKDGYHGDTSKMFVVGKPSILAERLMRVTQESLYKAIKIVKPGTRLGDIGHIIQKYAEGHNYSVVREYCGHGIGATFHEEPQVVHYGSPGTGDVLEAGMCFTIEPMINAGKRHSKVLPDKWTVVTKDRSLSAQWEHTLLVTEDGVEVLTLRDDEALDRIIHHQ
jgi:methionyl aminopeptidase